MDDDRVTHRELEEFRRLLEVEHQRLGDENERQNKRIETLEEKIEEIVSINRSVERLAANMEGILKEQVAQGNRLQKLEDRDGEMWRKAISYIVTAIIGVFLGILSRQLGI